MTAVAVLDDDEDLGKIFCETVRALGADKCCNYRSLASMISDAQGVLKCNVVVLDVNLGEGVPSGIDAYNWLRSHQFGGKVVFLTGHALSHPLVAKAVEQQSAIVYEKPIGIRDVAGLL